MDQQSQNQNANSPGCLTGCGCAIALIFIIVLAFQILSLFDCSSSSRKSRTNEDYISTLSSRNSYQENSSDSNISTQNDISYSYSSLLDYDYDVSLTSFDAGKFRISIPASWTSTLDFNGTRYVFRDSMGKQKLWLYLSPTSNDLSGYYENRSDTSISTTQTAQVGSASEEIVMIDFGDMSGIQSLVTYSSGRALFIFADTDDISNYQYVNEAEKVLGSFSESDSPLESTLILNTPGHNSLPGSSDAYVTEGYSGINAADLYDVGEFLPDVTGVVTMKDRYSFWLTKSDGLEFKCTPSSRGVLDYIVVGNTMTVSGTVESTSYASVNLYRVIFNDYGHA